MNFSIRIPLTTTPEQQQRLQALQAAVAQVCNAISPVVQQTRCWNRVALHHMVYKPLREKFPDLGSQMVCNAIYSVSRTCRLVFQHPDSPFNIARIGAKPLPLLRFDKNCPVYFDRHTLSVKDGQLSMYTLDGRMRFELALKPPDEAKFHDMKLLEIVLSREREGAFELAFSFIDEKLATGSVLTLGGQERTLVQTDLETLKQDRPDAKVAMAIPKYVMVEESV
jgi:hypothetical protein